KTEQDQELKQGESVTIVHVKGLTLTVKPNDRPKE
ncbi:NfeD family protein, partial [Vibrio sp. 2033]